MVFKLEIEPRFSLFFTTTDDGEPLYDIGNSTSTPSSLDKEEPMWVGLTSNLSPEHRLHGVWEQITKN